MQSSYITSAQKAEQLPRLEGPEVAFVGRSNVGKSSLLNALLGRNNLARASNTPGRTQMVNFFSVESGEVRVILADLPGYGFSAAGRDARAHWAELVDAYLQRPALREVLFLIDVRRAEEGLDETDLTLAKNLFARKPPLKLTVVLTKADKLNQAAGAATRKRVEAELAAAGVSVSQVVIVSSLKNKGIEELRKVVLGL